MAETIEGLLKEWRLEELRDLFIENAIDIEALNLLSEEIIQQLIPKVGLRVKFLKKWKQHFMLHVEDTFPVSIVQELFNSSETSSSTLSWVHASSDTDTDTDTTVVLPQDYSTCTSRMSVSESPPDPQQPVKRQETNLFDTKKILSKTASGRSVVKHLTAHGFLSKKVRHDLVSILVSHLIETRGKNPSAFEKCALAQSVIEAFPQLKDPHGITGYEAFYSRGAKRCPASGYLEEHLRYVRKQLIHKALKSGEENVTTTSLRSSTAVDLGSQITDDLQDKIDWMKTNTGPTTKVHEYMKSTYEYRREWIKNKERSVAEIVDEFPRLLDEGMIKQEFGLLYPGKSSLLLDQWESLQDVIIEYGAQQCTLWKELLQLQHIDDVNNLVEEQKQNLSLYFLPLILEGHKKAGGPGTFKTCTEVFIDTQPDIINIPAYIRKMDPSIRPQPFVLVLQSGESKLKPSCVFLIIEKKALPQMSLLAAVDACYKTHFVLDCKFQEKCKGVWYFLETSIFKQEPRGRKESTALRALRAYISFKRI